MRTPAEIADEAMDAFTPVETDCFDADETCDVEEASAAYIREQIIAAIDADRAQRRIPGRVLLVSRGVSGEEHKQSLRKALISGLPDDPDTGEETELVSVQLLPEAEQHEG